MKKKKTIIITIIIILLTACLIPRIRHVNDGGTVVYDALLYKVIVWHKLDGKSSTETHLFPNNFYKLGYYDTN